MKPLNVVVGIISRDETLRNTSEIVIARRAKKAVSGDLWEFPGGKVEANETSFEKAEDVPLTILLPAFITSELKTAFQIGFLLFLPFLVIDMVIASVLMSLGMMMLSPMLVSLPFKLLLFVLVDGWAMTVGSLVATYQVT